MSKARTALVSVASVALITTGGTMTASAASAAPAAAKSEARQLTSAEVSTAKAYSCTRGAVCFYTGQHGKGKRYQVSANSNRNVKHVNSMINNGSTSEKKDHVRVKWNDAKGHEQRTCTPPGVRDSSKKEWVVDAVRWVAKC